MKTVNMLGLPIAHESHTNYILGQRKETLQNAGDSHGT